MDHPSGDTTPNLASSRFVSFMALRKRHSALLESRARDLECRATDRDARETPTLIADIKNFVDRASQTGVILESPEDREAAAAMIYFWVNNLQRDGHRAAEYGLAPFDRTELEDEPELEEGQFPYDRDDDLGLRPQLLNEALLACRRSPLIALVGPSGSGRTSFAENALVPALMGRIRGHAEHPAVLVAPGSDPSTSLRRLRDLQSDAHDRPRILVIDDVETIFMLWSEQDQERWVASVRETVADAKSELFVILIIDSRYLEDAFRISALRQLLENATVHVRPFDAKSLREFIDTPANAIGLKFEEGLVTQLVDDVLGDPAALRRLVIKLQLLWDRRVRNRITWEAYSALGGTHMLRDSLEAFAERHRSQQETLRQILLQLVKPAPGKNFTTISVAQADLYRSETGEDEVDQLLKGLETVGFLRLYKADRSPELRVALTHETLVYHWPSLLGWVDEERQKQRRRLRLRDAAKAWKDRNRDPGALWRGTLLEEADRFRNHSHLETEFLHASWTALRRDERERLTVSQKLLAQTRLFNVALALGLVVSLLLVLVTALFYRRAVDAEHLEKDQRRLLTESRGIELLEGGDPSGAALWFSEALRISESGREPADVDGRGVGPSRIAAALQQLPVLRQLWCLDKEDAASGADADYHFSAAEFTPQGNVIAAIEQLPDEQTGEVRTYAVGSSQPFLSFRTKRPTRVGAPLLGLQVGAASDIGRASGEEGHVRSISPGAIRVIALSPDGQCMATGSRDSTPHGGDGERTRRQDRHRSGLQPGKGRRWCRSFQ